MERSFNITGTCNNDKHYMVDINSKHKEYKEEIINVNGKEIFIVYV